MDEKKYIYSSSISYVGAEVERGAGARNNEKLDFIVPFQKNFRFWRIKVEEKTMFD